MGPTNSGAIGAEHRSKPDKSKRCLWVIAMGAASIALAGCNATPMKRIKVTVEVNDNGRIYSGTAVQAVGCREANPMLGNMDTGSCTIQGEAVVVDLGSKGLLVMPFAGKMGYNPFGYISTIYSAEPDTDGTHWRVRKDAIPLMVTFDDPLQSSTVRKVDPENLEKGLGKGVELVAVRAEYTKEKVTWGQIGKVLPWLDEMKIGTYLTGLSVNAGGGLPSQLQLENFKYK